MHAWDLTSGNQSSPRSTVPGTQTCTRTMSGINIREGNDAWPEDQHPRELVQGFPLQEDPSPQPGISTSTEGDAAVPPGGNQVGFFCFQQAVGLETSFAPTCCTFTGSAGRIAKGAGNWGLVRVTEALAERRLLHFHRGEALGDAVAAVQGRAVRYEV